MKNRFGRIAFFLSLSFVSFACEKQEEATVTKSAPELPPSLSCSYDTDCEVMRSECGEAAAFNKDWLNKQVDKSFLTSEGQCPSRPDAAMTANVESKINAYCDKGESLCKAREKFFPVKDDSACATIESEDIYKKVASQTISSSHGSLVTCRRFFIRGVLPNLEEVEAPATEKFFVVKADQARRLEVPREFHGHGLIVEKGGRLLVSFLGMPAPEMQIEVRAKVLCKDEVCKLQPISCSVTPGLWSYVEFFKIDIANGVIPDPHAFAKAGNCKM